MEEKEELRKEDPKDFPNKITFDKLWATGVHTPAIRLHQAFTICGVTDSSFYEKNGYQMVWTPHGVFGKIKDKKTGQSKRFTVPLANVSVAEF